TALRLTRAAGPLAGRRALLTGASGGVGHYLTELLAGAGTEVVAVTSSDERGARLRDLGAAETVTTPEDAPGGYDLVFESVGGSQFSAALAKAAPGATVLWYGQAGLQPITIDFFAAMAQTPFTLKHFPHWISERTDAEDLATLVRLVAEDRLHPEIGLVTDWADTARVLDDVYGRRVRGNAVLTLG
ncbi:MAG: zinc-binding dehydrogenase, partial [Nonomuraea sp.]|nr:zinc-binding dehydrogenase [Nonomuraea sp.]